MMAGPEGLINVERSYTGKSYAKKISAIAYERGPVSDEFIPGLGGLEFEYPLVLVVGDKIKTSEDI
jgi:hypothetical protein